MNDTESKYQGLVEQINRLYGNLHQLSGDELRERIKEIKSIIVEADDIVSELNVQLPEVFAIVKETAKRFSEGRIIVTATSNDKLLEDRYDFVYIDGNKAIYKNCWEVDGELYTWDMVHYDEQLLAGIYLHHGTAIEMATGEGKTLVATLPTFLNALTGNGVHIMTVNDYLSKRDYQITRPLYLFYGLSVDCIEFYERCEYGRKEAYASDITFGANSSFVFDYLFDHLAIDPKDCVQSMHNYAIIDEIDSILIDEAHNPHIVSGGMSYYDGKIYQEYIGIVKELIGIENETLYLADKLLHSARFTDNGKLWLSRRLEREELFNISKTYEVSDFESLSNDKKNLILNNIRIQNVLQQLLNALVVYERDVDYIVVEGKVKIIDQNTGRIKENSRWEHGLHTALEVKESVTTQPNYDGVAIISLKNYFILYSKVSGMSGSIYPVKKELYDIYGLKTIVIPTHLPVIRNDKPLRIYKSSKAKDEAIISNIIANRNEGRPSLIGTISLKRADEIEQLLVESELKFNRLDARTTKNEALTVAKAGIGNTITLSTSVAGRGTDIKPSYDALKNGGLSVIGCDLFGSIRTDLQLKGRTGRQGNPGDSIFYASLNDVILEYLSDSERAELNALASQFESDEISSDQIRKYFEIAQSKREESFRIKRTETALKDDIVAPHRTKFYYQRNQALFNAEYASELINKLLIAEKGSLIVDCDSHLSTLYEPTKILVSRSKRNNPTRERIYIPFSENKHTFAILLDVDLLVTGKEYFKREFKRQNLLQVYDKFWKDFVIYIMQNLDQREISRLSDVYHTMLTNINTIIIKRMTESVPSFMIDMQNDLDDKEPEEIRQPKEGIQRYHITPKDLCPCGSGIAYCKCHGRQGNCIIRRRY